jgi:hypothetical protein
MMSRHALVELERDEGFGANFGCKLHPGEAGQLPRLLSSSQTGGHQHQSRYALVGVPALVLVGQVIDWELLPCRVVPIS